MLFYQSLQVDPVQVLHDVIEDAITTDPEIIKLHGVGRAKGCCGLGFPFEATDGLPRNRLVLVFDSIGADQLDGSGSNQLVMLRSPDLSHAS